MRPSGHSSKLTGRLDRRQPSESLIARRSAGWRFWGRVFKFRKRADLVMSGSPDPALAPTEGLVFAYYQRNIDYPADFEM